MVPVVRIHGRDLGIDPEIDQHRVVVLGHLPYAYLASAFAGGLARARHRLSRNVNGHKYEEETGARERRRNQLLEPGDGRKLPSLQVLGAGSVRWRHTLDF